MLPQKHAEGGVGVEREFLDAAERQQSARAPELLKRMEETTPITAATNFRPHAKRSMKSWRRSSSSACASRQRLSLRLSPRKIRFLFPPFPEAHPSPGALFYFAGWCSKGEPPTALHLAVEVSTAFPKGVSKLHDRASQPPKTA